MHWWVLVHSGQLRKKPSPVATTGRKIETACAFKATVASLQANPVPQTFQLAELKDIREELQALKDSQEGGWKTVVRNMSQQAHAPQQQERVLNAVLKNFEEVEGETSTALLERMKAKLGYKLGINVELSVAYWPPAKRSYATAAKGEA